MNNPRSFTKPLFAVFSVMGLLIPAVSHADSEYMAQKAHKICLEYGAKPGTRLFLWHSNKDGNNEIKLVTYK